MLLMMIAAFAFASCGSHNHDDHKEGSPDISRGKAF